MEIVLKRRIPKTRYTIGKLFIDGKFLCETLEDKDRGLKDSMSLDCIKDIKIMHRTAIPYGRYLITMNMVSPKFKTREWAVPYEGKLPRLLGVKGFTGILIHVGNTSEDTSGCILVGMHDRDGILYDSRKTFDRLMNILLSAKDSIYITITSEYK